MYYFIGKDQHDYTVINLADAFFPIPIRKDKQNQLVFMWARSVIDTLHCLHGYGDSPALFHNTQGLWAF